MNKKLHDGWGYRIVRTDVLLFFVSIGVVKKRKVFSIENIMVGSATVHKIEHP
jgi:hypothetical protein